MNFSLSHQLISILYALSTSLLSQSGFGLKPSVTLLPFLHTVFGHTHPYTPTHAHTENRETERHYTEFLNNTFIYRYLNTEYLLNVPQFVALTSECKAYILFGLFTHRVKYFKQVQQIIKI